MAIGQINRAFALIGEIATTWSEVELVWYLLFTIAMEPASRSQADAVFFMFETSARQRRLVISVADAKWPTGENGHKHPIRERLGQLNTRTDACAHNRNAAIHAILQPAAAFGSLSPKAVRVLPGTNPNRKNRFSETDALSALSNALVEIKTLLDDLLEFHASLVPAFEIHPDMIDALQKLGFQIPLWVKPFPLKPDDQQ